MKQIALIIISVILLFSFSSCSGIPEKPEDTNLEFWITQDVSEVDFSGLHEIVGWFGARQYYGSGYLPAINEEGHTVEPEHYVKYLVTAWPDYADGGEYITLIEFTDPEVTVYGLTVDSSFDEFQQVFNKMGYKISKDSSETFERCTAVKKGLSFSLEAVNGKRRFLINAEVTNKKGIVF